MVWKKSENSGRIKTSESETQEGYNAFLHGEVMPPPPQGDERGLYWIGWMLARIDTINSGKRLMEVAIFGSHVDPNTMPHDLRKKYHEACDTFIKGLDTERKVVLGGFYEKVKGQEG